MSQFRSSSSPVSKENMDRFDELVDDIRDEAKSFLEVEEARKFLFDLQLAIDMMLTEQFSI
jgi:hypothetical protein